MSDTVAVSSRLSNLEVSPQFAPYSKVIINKDENTAIIVGDDTGRTLEFDNPYGTQAMANNILAALSGYKYQPYEADGALLDPAAEIGDAITMTGNYGGMYRRNRKFGRLMKADIAAPHDEEIDHEYQYEPSSDRKIKRQFEDVSAELSITSEQIQSEVTRATQAEGQLSSQITQAAEEINANVVKKQGGNNASFGWKLDANGFYLYSNSREVMRCNSGGLTVTGNIDGTTGTIGGFTIKNGALFTNNMEYYSPSQSTQNSGVHLSSSGIRLGKNFLVDSSGNLTCTDATITGTLNVGGSSITAENLRTGAERANSGYSSWNNAATSTSSGGFCYGASTSWNNAKNSSSGSYPSFFKATSLYCTDLFAISGNIYVQSGGSNLGFKNHSHVISVSGGTVTVGAPSNQQGSFSIADTSYYKNGVSAAYNNGYSAGYSKGGSGVVVNWNQYETYIYSMGTNSAYVRIKLSNGTSQFGWIYTR